MCVRGRDGLWYIKKWGLSGKETQKPHGKFLIKKNENRKTCPIYTIERGEENGNENGFCEQYLLLILSSCSCCCTYSVERKRRE